VEPALPLPAARAALHHRLGGEDRADGAALAGARDPRPLRRSRLAAGAVRAAGQPAPAHAGRIVDLYPDLELIIHGGVSFAPYKARFDALLEGSKVRPREVYAGVGGLRRHRRPRPGEGMRLVADNGMFFEFVPVDEIGKTNPTRLWVGDVEPGVDYAIALTTCAGCGPT
jgi:hypothetical protein